MTHSAPNHDYATTEEIEADIARERGRIVETVEALQNRIDPRETMTRAFETVTSEGEAALSTLVDTVRRNPVPAMLIGAGVAWLIFGASGRQTPSGVPFGHQAGKPVGGYRRSRTWTVDDHVHRHDMADGDRGGRSGVNQMMRDAAQTGSETVEAARRRAGAVGEAAGEAFDAAARRTRRMGADVAETARSGRRRAASAMEENPLLAGALAFAAGAALGAATPNTAHEDKFMGEHAERLRRAAESEAQTAVRAARDAGEAALAEARTVAAEAVEAALDAAPEPKVVAETLSQKATETAERIADAAAPRA